MTDYTDLSRFDTEILHGMVYMHQQEITKQYDKIHAFQIDIQRIYNELGTRT